MMNTLALDSRRVRLTASAHQRPLTIARPSGAVLARLRLFLERELV